MTDPGLPQLSYRFTSLDAHHAPHFAGFTCARPGEPWTAETEVTIRRSLVGLLAKRMQLAFGVWLDDELIGIATHGNESPDVWAGVVAVRTGYDRKGLGQALVRELVRRAAPRDVLALIHPRNEAAIRTAQRAGATLATDPRFHPFVVCRLPGIRPWAAPVDLMLGSKP